MIAALMEMTNALLAIDEINKNDLESWDEAIEFLCLMLAPICPHISEELWMQIGKKYSIHKMQWPNYVDALTLSDTKELPIQINGKLRVSIDIMMGADESTVLQQAKENEKIANYLEKKEIIKVIYIQDKLLNIVIK